MDKTPKYTAAQVAFIENFAGTGTDGRLTFADAGMIAAAPEMAVNGEPRKARSITAKIKSLQLPYENKGPVRKDGSPVVSKRDLVAAISEAAGVTFEALDKAARADLVKLRDALAA